MWPRRILFFREVLPDQSLQRTFRPCRQHPQVLRKRFHVPVILRRVKLQRLAAQFPRLPILVKRVLQQILFRDRRIQLPHQFRVPHGRSPSAGLSQSFARAHTAKIVARIVPNFSAICLWHSQSWLCSQLSDRSTDKGQRMTNAYYFAVPLGRQKK